VTETVVAVLLTPWRHTTAVMARVWAFLLFGFVR
jgi:hypothetical protein